VQCTSIDRESEHSVLDIVRLCAVDGFEGRTPKLAEGDAAQLFTDKSTILCVTREVLA
jgi:hypothetical protein